MNSGQDSIQDLANGDHPPQHAPPDEAAEVPPTEPNVNEAPEREQLPGNAVQQEGRDEEREHGPRGIAAEEGILEMDNLREAPGNGPDLAMNDGADMNGVGQA